MCTIEERLTALKESVGTLATGEIPEIGDIVVTAEGRPMRIVEIDRSANSVRIGFVWRAMFTLRMGE